MSRAGAPEFRRAAIALADAVNAGKDLWISLKAHERWCDPDSQRDAECDCYAKGENELRKNVHKALQNFWDVKNGVKKASASRRTRTARNPKCYVHGDDSGEPAYAGDMFGFDPCTCRRTV